MAQTEVALYLILAKAQNNVVKATCTKLPEMLLGKLDIQKRADRRGRLFGLADEATLVIYLGGKCALANKLGLDKHRGCLGIGSDACIFKIAFGNYLVPDGLPDTGGTGVVAAVGVGSHRLLAAGLSGRAGIVVAGDGNIVLALGESVGNIVFKGNVAAEVVEADLFAVDPEACIEIGRADVEDHAIAGELVGCDLYFSLIPYAVHKVLDTDAGKLGFGAERKSDPARKGISAEELACLAALGVIDLKLPLAVEVLP